MLNRRDLLVHSAKLAALMASAGLLPQMAHAAYNAAAFAGPPYWFAGVQRPTRRPRLLS